MNMRTDAAQSAQWFGGGRRMLVDKLPLIILCLLPILLYFPFMGAPFERDEGAYATIAQGLLDGKVPYRDLFDNKPPLVYGWYAFSFLLFGESVIAPRIIAAVLLSLTTLSVFTQTRMMFPRGVAYIAAAIFAISTGLPFVALHANTEAYMLLPLTTSLAAFTVAMRNGQLRWFLLAGVLAGLAMMTKQVAVCNLLALAGVAVFWRWRAVPGWRKLAPAGVLLAGAVAATVAVAVPFAITGALDDMMQEIADMYQREVEYELKTLGAQIEPVLILCLGVLVLILALGVFLPIWDLGQAALKK